MDIPYHIPVMLHETVDGMAIAPGGVYADMTFGGGGHSREILRRMDSTGQLYSFDQDADAERNIVDDERFVLDFLREKHVLLVRGLGFHWEKPDHFRIVMLPEAGELRAAMERMGNFLDGYKQK